MYCFGPGALRRVGCCAAGALLSAPLNLLAVLGGRAPGRIGGSEAHRQMPEAARLSVEMAAAPFGA